MRLRADLTLILVCLIWGATFIVVKNALEEVSTMLFLAIRFSLASLALLPLALGRAAFRPRQPSGRPFPRFFPPPTSFELRAGAIVGFWLFSGYFLQTSGLRHTTAAKAGFITGFYIPLVPLLGALIYRRIPLLTELTGIALATAGTMLITMHSFALDSISRGDLLVLGGALAFAFHIVALGHYSRHVPFERLTFYQIAMGASMGLATFWWIETPRWTLSGPVIFALLLTSLLATAFAFSVQTWAQRFTTPTRTALIFSTEPIFAALTSYLLVGEVLGPRSMVGGILILAGILAVELKPAAKPDLAANSSR